MYDMEAKGKHKILITYNSLKNELNKILKKKKRYQIEICAPYLSKLKMQLGIGLESRGIKSYTFLSKPFQNHPG